MTDTIGTLGDEFWASYLQDNPTEAHLLGHYPERGRFEEVSRAAEDRVAATQRDLAQRAQALDDAGLDDTEKITRSVLVSNATTTADLLDARLAELSADPIFGIQTSLPLIAGMLGLPTAQVAETLPGTLEGIGQHFRDLAQRHLEGVEHGRTPAAFAVRGTIEQLDAGLAVPPDQDPVLDALHPPEGLDVAAWRASLVEAITKHVRPGMEAYRDALADEVLAHARSDEQCGLSWLDDGASAYAATLRFFTTTDRTAQDIHDVGLAQVASLADEYRALGADALGTSDLGEIFDKLRTDPALHFRTGDELVRASEVAMARAQAAMGDWFEVVPKAPCAVEGTLTGAKAFYFPPAEDGSRGGTFFVNIADPTSWGTFELEAMAFHEGIPGHHLQLAIAAELPDTIPTFRKHVHNSAYAEGWGLYSERLSDEMGLYGSQVDRIGMLAADSMRATRLVVDTGLHGLGWSRQQAVDYMLANTPLHEGVVRPEIDRYVVSPGQATSYMIGRLEIQRMRREAEQRLGDAFSVKSFHSAVLDNGSLPLGVLDQVVKTRLG